MHPLLLVLLGVLRTLIARPSTPPGLPDDINLAYFTSQLIRLPLEERPKLATPNVFSAFCGILTLVPPPPIVDAVCLALDSALRDPGGGFVYTKSINTAYAAQVCNQALAKALCNIVSLGPTYASVAVFDALRYFKETSEFKTLVEHMRNKFIELCEPNTSGVIRHAAQCLLAARAMAAYSALRFPKPDFPLKQACVFVTDPEAFLIDKSKFYRMSGHSWESVVLLPAIDRGKWQFRVQLRKLKEHIAIGIVKSDTIVNSHHEIGSEEYTDSVAYDNYSNDGAVRHRGKKADGNNRFQKGSVVMLEVDLDASHRTLRFFVDDKEQRVFVRNIPQSINFVVCALLPPLIFVFPSGLGGWLG
jgi:hypothetical protein